MKGERVRKARENMGLSGRDLAEILKVSPSSVSRWERGEAEPQDGLKEKIAQLLGVSVGYLMGEELLREPVMEVPSTTISVKIMVHGICCTMFLYGINVLNENTVTACLFPFPFLYGGILFLKIFLKLPSDVSYMLTFPLLYPTSPFRSRAYRISPEVRRIVSHGSSDHPWESWTRSREEDLPPSWENVSRRY